MRNLFHVLVSVLMWGLFGYYWYVVGRRQINVASLEAVGALALITLVGILLTMGWIAHNKKLASRNRRRGAPPAPPEAFEADHLGRPLAGDPLTSLKLARTVVIALDDEGHKVCTATEGLGE